MHEVSQGIGGVIAAITVLVRVDFQHVLRPMRIVLQYRQAFNQTRTARVNEQRRLDASRRISKPLQHFRPAIDPIRIRTRQKNTASAQHLESLARLG